MIIDTWQFNVTMALVCIILFFQFYKIAVRGVSKDGAMTIILQVIAGVSILVLVPLYSVKFPSTLSVYLLLLLSTIFYAINDRLQIVARKHLEVSVFSIINQLSNVFVIFIGLVVFKESFMIQKIVGAGLIFLGNIYLFYRKGKLELNRYMLIGVIANLALSIALSTDIGISEQFNLPMYISITLIVPAIMVKLAEKISLSVILEEYRKGQKKKYLYATGIFWSLAILFSLRAFSFGSITTIVPIISTAVLINVFVAYFFLKEKENILKKIVASLIVILGVTLTVMI